QETFNDASFSDNGKFIVTERREEENQTVQLWSIEGKQIQRLLSNETFNDASFSDNGKFIVTERREEENQTVQLWSVEGKPIQRLLSNETFNDASFSDNGKFIVTLSQDLDNEKTDRRNSINQENNRGSSDRPTVKLWSRDGKELASFPTGEKIDDLKFSPDNKLITTFDFKDNTVKFWTLAEDKPKALQEVRLADTSGVEFSPDSQLIATVNYNRAIQLWNRDGQELARLDFNDPIKQIKFSPDSKRLAISRENKAPILWKLKRDDWERQSKEGLNTLMNQACEKVKIYLKNKPKKDSDRDLCDGIEK
ncbi:MAG: hypothetical protein SW833_28265, partial [Cyanobacteriota bacterium]|nr:hypothetical protein [Cyanobacteriota bacterium]